MKIESGLGERLTKQESYELREEIRKYVIDYLKEQGSQGRITVTDVRAVFGKERCKEGFTRDRLNELADENILVAQQVRGFKIYFLEKSRQQKEIDVQDLEMKLALVQNFHRFYKKQNKSHASIVASICDFLQIETSNHNLRMLTYANTATIKDVLHAISNNVDVAILIDKLQIDWHGMLIQKESQHE